jgi:YesN/AraC family two-component response regulator
VPRVLIVDDHAVIRRGVQGILHGFPEWELCGEADNGREAVRLAETLRPEIIIMDVSMPVLNGLEATRIIRDILPDTKIVFDAAFLDGAGSQRLSRRRERIRAEIRR